MPNKNEFQGFDFNACNNTGMGVIDVGTVEYGNDSDFSDFSFGATQGDLPADYSDIPVQEQVPYDELMFDENSMSEMGAFLDENSFLDKFGSLANLEWLDPTQMQDPNRLPKPAVSNNPLDPLDPSQTNSNWVIPQLEEAWGVLTDGDSKFIPNIEKEVAEYREQITNQPQSGLPQPDEKDTLMQAIRLAHFNDLDGVKRILSTVKDEHKRMATWNFIKQNSGLMGNMFLMSDAFPEITGGGCSRRLQGLLARVSYLVGKNAFPLSSHHKVARTLSDIDWKSEWLQYRKMAAFKGFKVASGPKDYKQTLQAAVVYKGAKKQHTVHQYKEVKANLTQIWKERYAKQNDVESYLRQRAENNVKKAVEAGLLRVDEASRLCALSKTASVLSKNLATILQNLNKRPIPAAQKAAAYTGAKFEPHTPEHAPVKERSKLSNVIAKIANGSGYNHDEILNLLKFAAKGMEAGIILGNLNRVLAKHFDTGILMASESLLVGLQKKHESTNPRLYKEARLASGKPRPKTADFSDPYGLANPIAEFEYDSKPAVPEDLKVSFDGMIIDGL
jgi:hypothetical protein